MYMQGGCLFWKKLTSVHFSAIGSPIAATITWAGVLGFRLASESRMVTDYGLSRGALVTIETIKFDSNLIPESSVIIHSTTTRMNRHLRYDFVLLRSDILWRRRPLYNAPQQIKFLPYVSLSQGSSSRLNILNVRSSCFQLRTDWTTRHYKAAHDYYRRVPICHRIALKCWMLCKLSEEDGKRGKERRTNSRSRKNLTLKHLRTVHHSIASPRNVMFTQHGDQPSDRRVSAVRKKNVPEFLALDLVRSTSTRT